MDAGHTYRRLRAVALWSIGLGLVFALRLLTTSALPEGLDGTLFVRGVERYALGETRPHWPGYPVYLWAARLARLVVGDAALALHVVSVAASTAALAPIAALATRWTLRAGLPGRRAALAGVLASVAWVVVPFSWVTGSQMLSDPLGLLAALCLLWLCDETLTGGRQVEGRLAAAGFVGGLLLGIRLAYLGLLAPLAYVATVLGRRSRPFSVRPSLVVVVSLCLGVLPWLSWQLAHEGLVVFRAGGDTLRGHFAWWGGSVTTEPDPIFRLGALLEGWIVQGLGAWEPGREPGRLLLTGFWLATLIAGLRRLLRVPPASALVALWLGPYLVYTFLALDIAQPRYGLPVAALACVVAGLGVPGRTWLAAGLMAAWLAVGGTLSLRLATAQRAHPPIEHQLMAFLRAAAGPAPVVLYDGRTGLTPALLDDSDPASFLGVDQARLAARTRELEAAGRRVYSTIPAPDHPQDWRPVARFCWNEPLDLLASREVWLFLHAPGAPAVPPPECHRLSSPRR